MPTWRRKGKAKFPSYFSAELTQIWGAHNIQWIPNGRPGAGHFLIFDNGVGRVAARSVFGDPGDQRLGRLWEVCEGTERRVWWTHLSERQYRFFQVLAMAGQTMMNLSKQVTWGYSAMLARFFSPFVSGSERLANGNTQITSGMYGHLFEVTPAGNLVWEFRESDHAGNYVTDYPGVWMRPASPCSAAGDGEKLGLQGRIAMRRTSGSGG